MYRYLAVFSGDIWYMYVGQCGRCTPLSTCSSQSIAYVHLYIPVFQVWQAFTCIYRYSRCARCTPVFTCISPGVTDVHLYLPVYIFQVWQMYTCIYLCIFSRCGRCAPVFTCIYLYYAITPALHPYYTSIASQSQIGH